MVCRKGFTLFEVTAMVILAGVITAIAFPCYQSIMQQQAGIAAQNNLKMIGNMENVYYFNNGAYCIMDSGVCNTLTGPNSINQKLSLNVTDSYYNYQCGSGSLMGNPLSAFCCIAKNLATGQVQYFKCGGAGCISNTCANLHDNCGTVSNGCGGTLSCGSCASPNTCGGGGTANVCGCTPQCSGQACGASNGCGGTCSNGSCTSPNTCGGGGTPNVCGCTTQCSGQACGASDGCGGLCQGSCQYGTCVNGTPPTCQCTPSCSSNGQACGASNGCGGTCQGECGAWGITGTYPNLTYRCSGCQNAACVSVSGNYQCQCVSSGGNSCTSSANCTAGQSCMLGCCGSGFESCHWDYMDNQATLLNYTFHASLSSLNLTQAYTLVLTPSQSHCSGAMFSISVTDGASHTVPLNCQTQGSFTGTCSGNNFVLVLPTSGSSNFSIPATAFSGLSSTGPYTLNYTAVDIYNDSCTGEPDTAYAVLNSYGVGIQLTSGSNPSQLGVPYRCSVSSPAEVNTGSAN